jgi:hypothetical protein
MVCVADLCCSLRTLCGFTAALFIHAPNTVYRWIMRIRFEANNFTESPRFCTFPSPTRVKYHLSHKSGKSEDSEEPTESGLFWASGCETDHYRSWCLVQTPNCGLMICVCALRYSFVFCCKGVRIQNLSFLYFYVFLTAVFTKKDLALSNNLQLRETTFQSHSCSACDLLNPNFFCYCLKHSAKYLVSWNEHP